jgi:hypothetical protein
LQHRESFSKDFRSEYWLVHEELKTALEEIKVRAETRLLRNYSCALAAIKIMGAHIKLPFTYAAFFQKCMRTVADHNSLLKENNALAKFWKIIEYCFTRNIINFDPVDRKRTTSDYDIKRMDKIKLKRNNTTDEQTFGKPKQVLVIRFNLVYAAFAKAWREQNGTYAPTEGTILKYLQDQPYYIGLTPAHWFHNTNTSGFAFDYDILNQEIVLEANESTNTENSQTDKKTEDDKPLPF